MASTRSSRDSPPISRRAAPYPCGAAGGGSSSRCIAETPPRGFRGRAPRDNLPRSTRTRGSRRARRAAMTGGVEVGRAGAGVAGRWLMVAAYVALIFILSAQPGLTIPGTWEYRDKIAHILEYGGLGFLVWLAARATWPTQKPVNRAILVLLACSALGACDE